MSTKVDTKLDISKILSILSSAYSVYGYGWKLKISAKKNHNRKSHKQLKFLIAEEDCPESVKQKNAYSSMDSSRDKSLHVAKIAKRRLRNLESSTKSAYEADLKVIARDINARNLHGESFEDICDDYDCSDMYTHADNYNFNQGRIAKSVNIAKAGFQRARSNRRKVKKSAIRSYAQWAGYLTEEVVKILGIPTHSQEWVIINKGRYLYHGSGAKEATLHVYFGDKCHDMKDKGHGHYIIGLESGKILYARNMCGLRGPQNNTTSNMPSSDSANYLSRPWLRVVNSIRKNSSTADDSFRKVSNSVSKELTIA